MDIVDETTVKDYQMKIVTIPFFNQIIILVKMQKLYFQNSICIVNKVGGTGEIFLFIYSLVSFLFNIKLYFIKEKKDKKKKQSLQSA